MQIYSPPFAIVKKGEGYKIGDQLGGKYYFDKTTLISALYLLEKEPSESLLHDFSKRFQFDIKSRLQQLLEAGFLTIAKHKRKAAFNYEKIIERVLNDDAKENSILNIGTVTLASINRCPYNCKGCYVPTKSNTGDIAPQQKLEEVIIDAISMGANNITLSGGEVTSTADAARMTAELANFAKSEGVETITLVTTGYNLPDYLAMFITAGVNNFQISIDGFESYNDVYKRAKNATKRALEAIELCRQKGVAFSTNTVVTKQNEDNLSDFVELLIKNGVKNIRLSKIITGDAGLALNIEDCIKLDELIKNLKAKHGAALINGPFDNPYVTEDYVNCVAGKLYAHIDSSGEIWPCAFMSDRRIGNINENRFKSLWTLENPVLNALFAGENVAESCGNCKKRFHCFGNCLHDYEIKKQKCQNG
ncbi:MAG: radical SAM protein [Nanoarchaeota archaeon]|nr:radical SAM protein [Nanoarchaeota archaeon]